MYHPHESDISTVHLNSPLYLRFVLMILALAANSSSAGAQVLQGPPVDGTDPTEIVWMMVARNETRAHEWKHFSSLRHYHLEVHAPGQGMAADMRVLVTYVSGSRKAFQIVEQSGSNVLLTHVLKRLIETEQIDSEQPTDALTPFDYSFTFDGESYDGPRQLYVFTVEPRRRKYQLHRANKRNNLLFRGRIWIDPKDFAVVRVEAEPAENPPFWIQSTTIHHSYEKIAGFWLPQANRTESKVRLGGTAVLTIDYGIYRFDEAQAAMSPSTNKPETSKALLETR